MATTVCHKAELNDSPHQDTCLYSLFVDLYQQTGNSISYFYDILRSVLLDVFNVMNPLSFIVNL